MAWWQSKACPGLHSKHASFAAYEGYLGMTLARFIHLSECMRLRCLALGRHVVLTLPWRCRRCTIMSTPILRAAEIEQNLREQPHVRFRSYERVRELAWR